MSQSRFEYPLGKVDKGYAGKTLYVNLSDGTIESRPVTEEMKKIFTGGRGFDLWLLWNGIGPRTAWDDPGNEICISSGPLGGTTLLPGSGKSIAATISPLTGSVVDSNVGGYFGPYLKFSGWDALEIKGKAEQDVVIVIDGDKGQVILEPAGELPDDSHLLADALAQRYSPGNPGAVATVSAGSGSDHSLLGCLNFSYYDNPRKTFHFKQAGRGGTGTVFRDKKIKAVVAKLSKVTADINHPADPERLKEVGRAYNKEIRELDPQQNEMSLIGTTHLVTIMSNHDTPALQQLPVRLPSGGREDGPGGFPQDLPPRLRRLLEGLQPWLAPTRSRDFKLTSGPYAGQSVWVDGPEYETIAGCGSNWGVFDPGFVVEVNFYCDTYGLDTISVGTGIAFVMECFERGLISKEDTGGLEIRFGNKEAALALLHQLAKGEGFGAHVGQGIRRMKTIFAEKFGADPALLADIGMESKGLEFSEYMTKESLAQQGGYGLALKGPQHDEAWLIFLDAVHNLMPTFEQKAENLYWFPMWRTWFSLNGLCKLPWNDIVPVDNHKTQEPAKVIKHIDWYRDYYSAVSGQEMTLDGMIRMSERVYNFQRIFNLRQGFGRREHDSIPYRGRGSGHGRGVRVAPGALRRPAEGA